MKTSSLFDLTGKRALITGSSRGIGFALAKGLAGAGADIILNGRDGDALEAAAQELAKQGGKVSAIAFDVSSPDSVNAAIDYAEAKIGPVDILINNAGMQHRAPLEDFPVEKFDQLIATNVNSVFYVGQAVGKYMIERGAGKIINICSVTSLLARPSVAPYTASKGAVANLTKGMAADWAKHGLNVNGIAPGYFKTELNAALVADEAFSAWVEDRTPMGRWAETSELVGTAVFLSSEASAFVNGQVIFVDGGMSVTL